MITAAKHYAITCQGREERFIKLPATFLGPNDDWRDYIEGPRVSQGRKNAFDRLRQMSAEADGQEADT
jgi:hypothetical protein